MSNLNVKCDEARSPPVIVTVVIGVMLTMRSIRLKVLNCDVFVSSCDHFSIRPSFLYACWIFL